MSNPVSAISEAISEVSALLREWHAGANVRRMRKAIEYSERIIRRYEKIYGDDKTINKYITKFFKYNN